MSSPTARCSSPRSKCGSPSIMNSQSCQFSSILLPRRHKISAQQVDQGSSTRTRNSSEPLYSWAAQWQPSCSASETRHPQRADTVLTGPRRASVGSSAPTLSERSGRRDRSTPCPFRAHSRRSQRGFKQQILAQSLLLASIGAVAQSRARKIFRHRGCLSPLLIPGRLSK